MILWKKMHLFKYLGYHLMFVEGFHIMRINNNAYNNNKNNYYYY